MSTDAKITRLAKVPLFSGCDRAHLRAIATIADDARYEAGVEIVRQGKRLRHAYIVVNGSCSVTIDGRTVGTVEPNEIIGDVTMFSPGPAAATVTATEPTDMIMIEHGAFIDTVRDHPELAITLLKTLARRFRDFR